MANENDETQRIINELLDGLGPADIQGLAQHLVSTGAGPVEQLDAATKRPSSRRRPRRKKPVMLRVRADLSGTQPPVWRRLELASDLFLDEVHEIMQAAFGWTDSHLHRFGSGAGLYSRETEYYLCPFSVDDGDDGVPEDQVRLDEVLVEVGDRLFYEYDFGDDWRHVIRLEEVSAREESTPRALCSGGRRPGPAEDCGGVGGYELLVAVTDPAHPEHAEACAAHAEYFGPEIDPQWWAPTPFDIEQVNGALADLDTIARPHEMTGPIRELFDRIRYPDAQHRLRRLVGSARLGAPVLLDTDAAVTAVRPYLWLLARVGDDGIKLTQAGYLPPVHVAAAFTELGFDKLWVGAGNREDLTVPVLDLRQSAQRLGLLRKHRGHLLTTTRGRQLRTDPIGLWWHLAERTPTASNDRCGYDAGLLYLVAVAAETDADRDSLVAELLDALGWIHGDGSRITALSAVVMASEVKNVLRRMDPLSGRGRAVSERKKRPTRPAVDFARAALTVWPA